MKIIFKQNEEGNWCLYDTRSEKFFPNSCVRNPEASSDILESANEIVNKPFKVIVELAQSFLSLENIIAEKYLLLNPDIKQKVTEKLNKPKVNRKMVRRKKGRTEKPIIEESTEKKKRGRPKGSTKKTSQTI